MFVGNYPALYQTLCRLLFTMYFGILLLIIATFLEMIEFESQSKCI